jgi:hypothetical protein
MKQGRGKPLGKKDFVLVRIQDLLKAGLGAATPLPVRRAWMEQMGFLANPTPVVTPTVEVLQDKKDKVVFEIHQG